MKYLLDTNVISDLINEVFEVKTRYDVFMSRPMCVSTATVKEIEYGLKRNPARALKIRRPIERLLSSMNILAFSNHDAVCTGKLRAELATEGTPIGPWDVMIAGTALARELVLVTANTREFSRVPGLRIEDWRAPINEVRDEPALYGHGHDIAA